MFQYAALKGIAAHRGFDFCLSPLLAQSELTSTFNIPSHHVEFSTHTTIQEDLHHFNQQFFDTCPDNVDLLGYFQTEKYFKHIEQLIRNDFTFHETISTQCQTTITNIRNTEMIDMGDVCSTEIIAMHIRRGDYVTLQDYHPVLPIEYYTEALAKMPYVHVLVFSDDIEWCQQYFKGSRFFFSKSNTSAADLCLMSMCDYHIIANSSFSWWGAWLSKSKQVIAPAQWFGPALSDKNTVDVYCDGWIKL
jgi:hypothetical protein